MGLKQDIVIKNRFSMPIGNGQGSRGGTPGDYVLRYMSRLGAVEDLAPVRLKDEDEYIRRYMMRETAVEVMPDIPSAKRSMREAQGIGGIAFTSGDSSLSDAKVRRLSRDIQHIFEDGHVALETVFSFSEDYLKRRHVVSEDFECQGPGSYKGHVDQMKLRLAIMRGMDRLKNRFEDLRWVGVIQVDTEHVHCHICAADARGHIREDGFQKGMLNEADKRVFRRGVDLALDEMEPSRLLAASVALDRRNVRRYVSRFAHALVEQRGLPQFLLACLPDDRRLWRASTNAKEMRKANTIVGEYVEALFKEPDSGYKEAMREIAEYASTRRKKEDLSLREERAFIENGRARMVEECMNSVYAVLAEVPKQKLSVRTPLMDAMSLDFEQMAALAETDPMVEFGFRLRSYSSRLEKHTELRRGFHEKVEDFRREDALGHVADDARPLLAFYEFEEAYHDKLMSKYRHFLSFLPGDGPLNKELADVLDYRGRVIRLEQMSRDRSIRRMGPKAADEYGQKVYGQVGGRLVREAPEIIETRIAQAHDTLSRKVDEFRFNLAEQGALLVEDEDDDEDVTVPRFRVMRGTKHDFDDVKALDLHHLTYDFPYDVLVSQYNVDAFINEADERWARFRDAERYLRISEQEDALKDFPVNDIVQMHKLADEMRGNPVLARRLPEPEGRSHGARTVRLDDDFTKAIKIAVEATVSAQKAFGE